LHSCEIAPFRMPRLAHVLRAEPQISLRRTGRCPAWDRVDGLGFMHRGRMACSRLAVARPSVQLCGMCTYCDVVVFSRFYYSTLGIAWALPNLIRQIPLEESHPSRTVERIPQTKNDARSTAARGPRHPIISVHYCTCFKIKCRSSIHKSGQLIWREMRVRRHHPTQGARLHVGHGHTVVSGLPRHGRTPRNSQHDMRSVSGSRGRRVARPIELPM